MYKRQLTDNASRNGQDGAQGKRNARCRSAFYKANRTLIVLTGAYLLLRLLFLLMGGPMLRASWSGLLVAGLLCLGASAGIVLESLYHGTLSVPLCLLGVFLTSEGLIQAWRARTGFDTGWAATVSYTHLTLPTNSVWCRSRWSPYH